MTRRAKAALLLTAAGLAALAGAALLLHRTLEIMETARRAHLLD